MVAVKSNSRFGLVDRWLLNFGAVLGTLCLVLAAFSLVFGLKPLIFTSGSMAPAIPTGALAFAVPATAAEVSPGEVVSIVAADGTRVSHRVVSADPLTGLVLKGDANAVADLNPFTGATVDRVLFSFPGLGYVVSWLASPWVFLLGGLLCAYLIYVAFFRHDPRRSTDSGSNASDAEVGKPASRHRRWLSVAAILTTFAVVVPLGAASSIDRTRADWLASATAVASITAATMVPPVVLDCQGPASGNKSVTVTWVPPTDDPVAVDHYVVTVTVGGKVGERIVGAGSTSQILSISDAQGLLGGLLAGLGNLLDFLLGGPKPVGVSVVAVYPGDWKSVAMSNSNVAEISSYALVSTKIACK